jgi:hypothetical protein
MACEEHCLYSDDGACDDGGDGAEFAVCSLGTDCRDCGARERVASDPSGAHAALPVVLRAHTCSGLTDFDTLLAVFDVNFDILQLNDNFPETNLETTGLTAEEAGAVFGGGEDGSGSGEEDGSCVDGFLQAEDGSNFCDQLIANGVSDCGVLAEYGFTPAEIDVLEGVCVASCGICEGAGGSSDLYSCAVNPLASNAIWVGRPGEVYYLLVDSPGAVWDGASCSTGEFELDVEVVAYVPAAATAAPTVLSELGSGGATVAETGAPSWAPTTVTSPSPTSTPFAPDSDSDSKSAAFTSRPLSCQLLLWPALCILGARLASLTIVP